MSSTTAPTLILYGVLPSPPTRSVLLTLAALNLKYELRDINVATEVQLNADYLKKHPQHNVPTLQDGENLLFDAQAICAYLVRKYGKCDALYPQDHYKRAICDHRLHYANGILFNTCLKPLNMLVFLEHATQVPKSKIELIFSAYNHLESFLDNQLYMAGNNVTIADFCIISIVSSFHLTFAKIDPDKHSKLHAWLQRMHELPYYESANLAGAQIFAERIQSKLPRTSYLLWQRAFNGIRNGDVS